LTCAQTCTPLYICMYICMYFIVSETSSCVYCDTYMYVCIFGCVYVYIEFLYIHHKFVDLYYLLTGWLPRQNYLWPKITYGYSRIHIIGGATNHSALKWGLKCTYIYWSLYEPPYKIIRTYTEAKQSSRQTHETKINRNHFWRHSDHLSYSFFFKPLFRCFIYIHIYIFLYAVFPS